MSDADRIAALERELSLARQVIEALAAALPPGAALMDHRLHAALRLLVTEPA